MPINMKCPACKKGLKLPDKVAGKNVACPLCKAKISVPAAEDEEGPPDSGELLANVDLRKLEDHDASVCPACGAETYDEDEKCRKCGFNLAFENLNEAKKAAAEGPRLDLRPFYANMISGSWDFTKAEISFVIRTWIIYLISSSVAVLVLHLNIWCATWPTKSFWLMNAVVSGMIPLGWTLLFHLHIIRRTMQRKNSIGKYPFDYAQSSMAGMVGTGWYIAYSLPFLIVFGGGGYFAEDFMDLPYGTIGGFLIAFFFTSMFFPQAFSHLAMPVTYRGFLLPETFKTLNKSFAPGLYWWFMFWATNLAPILVMIGALFLSQNSVAEYRANLATYAQVHEAVVKDKLRDKAKDPELPKEVAAMIDKKLPDQKWSALLLPGLGLIISTFLLSFSNVFNARSNGYFTHALKNNLNLITHKKELVWVSKKTDDGKIDFNFKRSDPSPANARLLAGLIDMGAVTFISVIFIGLVVFGGMQFEYDFMSEANRLVLVIVSVSLVLVIALIYQIAALSGDTRTTPGKQIFNLYICTKEGEKPGMGGIIIREIIYILPLINLISGIMIFTNPEAKSLGDMAGGTLIRQRRMKVVKKKEKEDAH
jgi:uncharacterized RDD family membrane protein YckC/ribosomal protein L40E